MAARSTKRTSRPSKLKTTLGSPRKLTPAIVTGIASTAADTIEITFSTRVITAGLPGYTAGAGGAETVASMTIVSDTVIELVFTGDVQGTTMSVPEGDDGIRTAAGGFVPAGSYAVPTFP